MLEAMRRQSRSVLIYVFFGIIIVVFVTTFGPSSDGFASCTSSTAYVAKVEGRTVSQGDFRYAFVLVGGADMGSNPKLIERVRSIVLDKLIERELLASRAEGLGLRVADAEIDDMLAAGSLMALGVKQDAKTAFFSEGVFDYELFERFCKFRLNQSVKEIKEQQRRELLAARVRDLMRAAVRVSDEEVRADFENRARQVNLEFVRFVPGAYAAGIQVSAAEADGFLAQNKQKVEERFHTRSADYKGLPKQVRARHILVTVAKDADQPTQKAARVRAEALLVEARASADFAALARDRSDHEPSRAEGGDLRWRARGGSGFGGAFEDAAFSLKPGGISDLVRSDTGWHIVKAEAFREGDQKLAAVQQEIARDLLREQRATERARLEAEDRLRRLRAGESWETMFPAEEKNDEGVKPVPMGALIRRETGPFTKSAGALPSIGIAKELARDAFEMNVADPLGKKVYDTSGGPLVVVRLKDRRDPDMKDFDNRKAEVVEDYRLAKWTQLTVSYVLQRCQNAHRAHDLMVSESAVAADGEEAGYVPCSTLSPQ